MIGATSFGSEIQDVNDNIWQFKRDHRKEALSGE
jgi:hypothetical protein